MNKLILIMTMLLPFQSEAQDVFEILFESEESRPIITDVDSMISTTYNYNYDDIETSDTVIIVGSDTVGLNLRFRTVTTYPSESTTVDDNFSFDEHSYRLTTVQDKKGRTIKEVTEFSSSPRVAEAMNSTRKSIFEDDRLVRIIENNVEILVVEYDEEYMPKTLKMNAGFMSMLMERKGNTTGYRYDSEMIVGEGVPEMFRDKINEAPEMYALYKNVDGLHHMTYIEKDRNTEEIISELVVIRDSRGHVVERKEKGHLDYHKKFVLNEEGQVIETHDLRYNKITKHEVDASGKILSKYEDDRFVELFYDERSRVIEERHYYDFERKKIKHVIMNDIFYKK